MMSKPPEPAGTWNSPVGLVMTSGWMPKNGRVADRAWWERRRECGAIMMAAGLGLPPGIDDGAAIAPDLLPIPHPRFGIDRLAYSSEQAQRDRDRMRFDMLVAPLDKGADRGGRGVEDGDAVVVDDLPEA